MVLEHALLPVKPGEEAAFEAAFAKVKWIISSMPGFRKLTLSCLGSGELVRSLQAADLIDEYLLLIHPLVLGQGRRLFEAGGPSARFELVDSVATTKGLIIATYVKQQGRRATPSSG